MEREREIFFEMQQKMKGSENIYEKCDQLFDLWINTKIEHFTNSFLVEFWILLCWFCEHFFLLPPKLILSLSLESQLIIFIKLSLSFTKVLKSEKQW